LPGDRENVVKLNADHSGVCKFGASQTDQDNFKLVRSNIKDVYSNALKKGEFASLSYTVGEEGCAMSEGSLEARIVGLRGYNVNKA
jgi:hypothetical protein